MNNNNFAQFVRIATLPPIVALATLILIYVLKPEYCGSVAPLLVGIAFLCFLPTLAYPAQKLLPSFKDKARAGQRTLAIIFSAVGYVACCIFAFAEQFPKEISVYFLTYFVSGLLILVCDVFHLKPSGHACGVAGPIVFLAVFVSPWFLFGLVVLLLTLWASIKLKRHSLKEFCVGSVVPIVAMMLSSWIVFSI